MKMCLKKKYREQHIKKSQTTEHELTIDEIQKIEILLYKVIQTNSFLNEINENENDRAVHSSTSKINYQASLIDKNGLILLK